MFLGWRTLNIGEDGMPTAEETQWKASCFVLFFWIIYIGKVEAK